MLATLSNGETFKFTFDIDRLDPSTFLYKVLRPDPRYVQESISLDYKCSTFAAMDRYLSGQLVDVDSIDADDFDSAMDYVLAIPPKDGPIGYRLAKLHEEYWLGKGPMQVDEPDIFALFEMEMHWNTIEKVEEFDVAAFAFVYPESIRRYYPFRTGRALNLDDVVAIFQAERLYCEMIYDRWNIETYATNDLITHCEYDETDTRDGEYYGIFYKQRIERSDIPRLVLEQEMDANKCVTFDGKVFGSATFFWTWTNETIVLDRDQLVPSDFDVVQCRGKSINDSSNLNLDLGESIECLEEVGEILSIDVHERGLVAMTDLLYDLDFSDFIKEHRDSFLKRGVDITTFYNI